MNRRRYLRTVGIGSLLAASGCSSLSERPTYGDIPAEESSTPTTGDVETSVDRTSRNRPDYSDAELPIPREALIRGARKDGIPAITDPAFASDWDSAPVGDADFALAADDRVIGMVREGEARAYPLRVLDWHEIVNDEFDGPILVSYCPLCGSGLTAKRIVRGEPTVFGVSGYLYQSDLVMYDQATESLWSQIMATAINGEATGDRLTLVPSTLTTWGLWHEDHPETQVLLPPPKSGTIVDVRRRDYERDPYAGYAASERIGIGFNDFDDDRLHPKAEVIGVVTDGETIAYPLQIVVNERVINDVVGGRPVVVAAAGDTLVAYDRRVADEVLTFEPGGERRMTGGGSTWRILTGEAIDGPYEGTRLDQANDATTMFWFAWVDFHPDTSIYGE